MIRPGAGPLRAGFLPLLVLLGCASIPHLRAQEGGGIPVPAQTALEFQQRAQGFYQRLLQRRFNTIDTFSDPVLRGHFTTEDLFFDYYSDLAQDLAEAHFEKSRPHGVAILEFLFDDPDHVQVQVRFEGKDGRPLRPDDTALVRQDRWVRADRTWWLVPGRS